VGQVTLAVRVRRCAMEIVENGADALALGTFVVGLAADRGQYQSVDSVWVGVGVGVGNGVAIGAGIGVGIGAGVRA